MANELVEKFPNGGLFKHILNMDDNMVNRLSLYIGSLGMTDKEFLLSVGLSKSIISKARVNGYVTEKTIRLIHLKYPRLNLDWLRDGVGDMLLPNPAPAQPVAAAPAAPAPGDDVLRSLYERLLQAKDEQLQAKDDEIKRLRGELAALRDDDDNQRLA